MTKSAHTTLKVKAQPRQTKNQRIKEQFDRAETLMEVALDLFAERDFASVTIKDIARAIGVNTALIYYYFDSKEALFRMTIDHAITAALENYKQLRKKHDNPILLINAWFDTNIRLSDEIRKLVKIMLDYCASRSSSASIDRLIKQFYNEEMSILSGSIHKGIAQGIFRPVDAQSLALSVSTHLDGIMVASMIRSNFNIQAAMNDLRRQLWEYLGYQEAAEWHSEDEVRSGRSTV